jgi:hypothetical protein
MWRIVLLLLQLFTATAAPDAPTLAKPQAVKSI